jgi:membrane protease subunit HflK
MEHFTPAKMSKYMTRKWLTLIIGGIILVSALGSSVYIVDQTQQAVITRFGRYYETKGEGLQFKMPFGIDRHYLVSTRTEREEVFGFRSGQGGIITARNPNESMILTGDLNIVDIGWVIQYQITDPRAWLFNVNDPVRTIRDVSRSVVNQLVGDRTFENIIGQGRNIIEVDGLALMNEIYQSYGLGITVNRVQLQGALPPPEVMQAFEAVNVATQERQRLFNEGQRAYNEVIPATNSEAIRVVSQAEGYQAERVNRANGDVARFNSVLAEYQRAPEVTRQRLYYEMMEEVFGKDQGTTIIDHNLSNFLPMLNLGGRR